MEKHNQSGCPCTIIEPCDEQCSCAHPGLSGGCLRCATYGSAEQRMASATRIAEALSRYAIEGKE